MRPPLRRAFLVLGLVVLATLVLFFARMMWVGARNDAVFRTQVSASGLRMEQAFPRDTWFFADFSTLAEGQRGHFETLLAQLTQDPEAFRAEFLRGIDENLKSVDLSYVEDIAPMVGEGGFRFALGMSEGGGDAPVTHAAMTVKDPAKAAQFLTRLEQQGRFLKKTAKTGSFNFGEEQVLYFNAAAFNANEQDIYYFTLFRDLLLAANDEKEVLEMVDFLKSAMSVVGEGATPLSGGQAGESLWTQPTYQEVVEELPTERVAFLYVNNGILNELRERQGGGAATSGTVAVKNLTHYLKGQGLAFTATASGLDFRGVALGDREALDADETTLDELRAHKTYLHKFMPSEGLAVYLESYGFANMVERQLGVSESKLAFLEGLGIGDLSSKGYSVALHQNSGFLPGLTVMVDVTDGRGLAGVLKESLDKKVSDLVSLLKFQGGALGESVSRESVMIQGGEFTAIRLNVKAFMEVYGQAGPFVLPDAVGGEDILLFYGITKEGQFLVSTYDGWLDGLVEGKESVPLSEDEIYEATRKALGEFKEGVVYVRFEPLLELLNTFQQFRGALRQDAEAVYAERAFEGEGEGVQDVRAENPVVIEQAPVDWAELLAPLQSFAFSSEAGKYRVRLGGSLMLKGDSEIAQ